MENKNPIKVSAYIANVSLKNKKIEDFNEIIEDLANVNGLRELDLSNNLIKHLPNDMSVLQTLTYLDITNNNLQNFENIAKSLATIPNLTELKINLSNQNDAIAILTNLPNLTFLNGKSTKEDTVGVDIEDKEIDTYSLNNEIENFNSIFNRINEKLKPMGKSSISEFFEEFQRILREEINKINNSVESTVPNYIYASNIIRSKMSIYSFFHNKLLNLLAKRDSEVVGILMDTMNYMQECHDSHSNLILKLNPKIEEKIESYKIQYEEALKQTFKSDIENELLKSEEDKKFIISQFEEERTLLLDKISKLESENRVMTDKLLQKAKLLTSEHEQENVNNTVSNSMANNNKSFMNRSNVNLCDSFANNRLLKSGANVIIGPVGNRVLTKKMLLDIIEEIYISKNNFDRKCRESKMPMETMEQHMYTYLNQKYGLKNLIIEWATCIINGIRMFSPEDSEVCLFGKILRNELEEDSRIVISKLKTTVYELLVYFLKAKNPLKNNSDINNISIAKQNGFLNEEEWRGILYYLFEKDDAILIETKINEFIKRTYLNNDSIVDMGNKKLTREQIQNLSKVKEDFKILYSDFVKIILDYQIKLRDKYLRNFYYIFKKVDDDNNGIIDEEEFVKLLLLMDTYPQENIDDVSKSLLNEIDPFNNKQITFSQCVNLFSHQFLIDGEQNKVKINILDKISINENILKKRN